MLDAAYAAGVRYVDAARSYGRAEEFLASWLDDRGIAPGALTVGSKWGYRYTGDWRMDAPVQESKDHSLAMFREQRAQTMALLGAHLDLYQVHSATFDSGILENREVLEALVELRADGVVVGLTVSGPHQAQVIERALDVDVDGTNPFSVVQATWNLLEPSAGPALATARERGWGVIVKEALANGRLAPRGAGDGAEAGPGERAAFVPGDAEAGPVAAAARVASRHGTPLSQLALTAAVEQPWADVVLSGAATPAQLEANLACLDHALSGDDLGRLASLAEAPDDYWSRRAALPWR
jgi:aryl-alcohol dehydrogenase-like predicted oxidoreductase